MAYKATYTQRQREREKESEKAGELHFEWKFKCTKQQNAVVEMLGCMNKTVFVSVFFLLFIW